MSEGDDMALGLSTVEAQTRLQQFGPNTIPEEHRQPILVFLQKLWGPVPWMLEGSIVLELIIGHVTQASIISLLLIFNAAISFLQENRAQNALALLQKRLTIQVRVLRDNTWQLLTADRLVPGDVVHLRMGDVVPADLKLLDGHVSADQSTLTGETLPAELGPGDRAYAGSSIQRGEATAEVTLTGTQTYFGRTAELVRVAHTASHLETTILGIVKYLIVFDAVLVVGVLIYAAITALPLTDVIPFGLMLLVASVPVALPATFTLASALGSQELAQHGVLVTRLSAIEEAAAMDVLCSDKTGTITKNQLVLSAIHAEPSFTEDEVLRWAALSSDAASQDPIDLAILKAADERQLLPAKVTRLKFVPFDPSTKRTEATVEIDQQITHIVKGFPQVVAELVGAGSDSSQTVADLAARGYRVLAIAIGTANDLRLVGLIGLDDPPREDSARLIHILKDELGVRVVMITGDALETARAVAAAVGLSGKVCAAEDIRHATTRDELSCDVVAGVLPEDKFHLVQAYQRAGHVVGMTGDGVNDAPALKQAEVGIAVSSATDVARAAASAVLTEPGLSNVRSAVTIGRQIYQRMLTYTYNKITKTFQIALFLSLGLFLTGTFVTTPRLVVLLLFANDFATMSLAADRVTYSRRPERWHIRPLVIGSLVLALAWLIFSFIIYFIGRDIYRLPLEELQTLVFVMLVLTGQANIYLVRERAHFWTSRPGRPLLISTLVDVSLVFVFASQGILMAPIGWRLLGGLLILTALYALALDTLKTQVFRRLG
jgi:H+-transporting ATPase